MCFAVEFMERMVATVWQSRYTSVSGKYSSALKWRVSSFATSYVSISSQGTVDFFLDFCHAVETCRVKISRGVAGIRRGSQGFAGVCRDSQGFALVCRGSQEFEGVRRGLQMKTKNNWSSKHLSFSFELNELSN